MSLILSINLSWWLILTIAAITLLYIHSRQRTKKRRIFYASLPGPPIQYPLFSILLSSITGKRVNMMQYLTSVTSKAQEYGLVQFSIGPKSFVMIADPYMIQDILADANSFYRSFYMKQTARHWVKDSLIESNPPKWKVNRKIIQQAFSQKVLDSFIPIFQRHSDVLVRELDKQLDDEFNLEPFISKFALDSICSTAMGVDINSRCDQQEFDDFRKSVNYCFKEISQKVLQPWMNIDFIFRFTPYYSDHVKYNEIFHRFIDNVYESKLKMRRERKNHRSDNPSTDTESDNSEKGSKKGFLEHLLDLMEKDAAESLHIRRETSAFIIAGYETTNIAISTVLFLLALHPEIQEKVHQEQVTLFDGTNVTSQRLSEMKYLEMVVKESLRRHSPAPLATKYIMGDIVLRNGLIIPKNVDLFLSIEGVHMNPKFWPRPEKFDPDRFLPDVVAQRPSCYYLPFSSGPRNCIGYKFAMTEILVVVSTLVRKFEFSTTKRMEDLRMVSEITKKSRNGYPVSLKRRKTPHRNNWIIKMNLLNELA